VRASLARRSWLLSGLADTLESLEGELDPGRVALVIAEQLQQRGRCRHVGVLATSPEGAEIVAEAGDSEDGEAWREAAREAIAAGSDAIASGVRLAVPFPRRTSGALVVTEPEGRPESVDSKALAAFADAAALALANAFKVARIEHDARRLTRTEALLSEMHHRIRGNLQTVADLLSTQRRHENSPQARRALDAAVGRIKSIAAVHDLLSSDLRGVTDTRDLIERLVTRMAAALADQANVRLSWHADAVELRSRQGSALGLIAHELVSNALRHGPSERGNRVVVSFVVSDGRATLRVRDNGAGLPESFHLERDAGVGLRVVKALAERELKGELSLHSEKGLSATVAFDLA
jgi:two-component sensor histidine kinase